MDTKRFQGWKRWVWVGLVSLALILFWQLPSPSAASIPESPRTEEGPRIEPALARALMERSDAPLRVIVRLRGEETTALLTPIVQADSPLDQKRTRVIAELQQQLDQAAAPLRPQLKSAFAQGDLLKQRDLWIINSLALEARPTLIQALQTSSAVAELRLDTAEQYVEPIDQDILYDDVSTPWGIEQIRAPAVWQTLGISGTGVVVASMDTGVEWQHPALMENYRGNLGKGLVNHQGAWFDAVNDGIYPYDDYGHGSHTLGTAVGRGGIGVAPGARWIGVKILDGSGSGYNSDIHAGFQWLLAPDGDPALAPDVVVCSWGSSQSTSTEFQADIEALQAAGIFPIFAAGNEGPQPGTLRSPGNLPGVFAVGASDPYEQVASFSSRGPSPWDEIKPYVVAPGVNIISSVPGGVYAEARGTSMATPHVAGIAALMRSAVPTVSIQTAARIITETALPLVASLPNNDSGWGRVDAHAALVALTQPGVLSGTVRGDAGPLAGAQVRAEPHGSGNVAQTVTDAEGHYALALSPGLYDMHATAFGHASETVWGLQVTAETVQHLNFSLFALPKGRVQGRATVAPSGDPPTYPLTLQALGTPITTTLDGSGNYALDLPTDDYVLELRGNGYRVITAAISIRTDETTIQDFSLTPAPTLLLVDEGGWYYQSQIPYWQDALDDLAYAYDEITIIDLPVASDFITRVAAYDAVLWSSPEGSPGLVNAGEVLTTYLATGGRLMLSGQDVALFDSGAALAIPRQDYLSKQLSVQFEEDNAPTRSLTGSGPFAGLEITITGKTGADNQYYPDEVKVRDPDVAESVWRYEDGAGGGLAAHICKPYRALFFSFGYEAIADDATRHEVMARSLDWLTLPPPTKGLTLTYQAGPRIGLPGEQITHTFRIRHIGSAGPADQLQIELTQHAWPATVTPSDVTLAPCEAQYFTVTTTIPPDAGMDESDFIQINAHSSLLENPVTTTLHTKTPAPVLLVDDDRWYPMEEHYKQALDMSSISYDIWDTDLSRRDIPNHGELLTRTLTQYPMVVWFTGYDWYAPVTEEEEVRLLHYLDTGGRLLLTSQDFLYYEPTEVRPLAERMGVSTWVYDRATKSAWGSAGHPAGGTWGPVALDFPFRNWSDAVEPIPGAAIVARGDEGQPLGLARGGNVPNRWRSIFYGFPLETLPLAARGEALTNGISWLSPLGTSTWSVTPAAPQPGERLDISLVLRNDALTAQTVAVTHTVPASLTVIASTLPPETTYRPAARQVCWSGTVAPDAPVTLAWEAHVNNAAQIGQPLTPTVEIELAAWDLVFARSSALRIGGADLGNSEWLSPTGAAVDAGAPITLTFDLRNVGSGVASGGTAQVWLMPGLAPITATLPPTQGTSLPLWHGELALGETQPLSLNVRPWTGDRLLRLDALLSDGTGRRWAKSLWLDISPWRSYLPVIYKNAAP